MLLPMRSMKLYTPMIHPITSQNMTLKMFDFDFDIILVLKKHLKEK